MAVKELEFKITWENGNFFKMEEKSGGGDWITTQYMEENSKIKSLTNLVQKLCSKSFNEHLADIMREMEA